MPKRLQHSHTSIKCALQAAVVTRLADSANEQHRSGLLRTLQLCDRFINSNASSPAAFEVLKEEVAKSLTKQQQQQVWIVQAASCTQLLSTQETTWHHMSPHPASGCPEDSSSTS